MELHLHDHPVPPILKIMAATCQPQMTTLRSRSRWAAVAGASVSAAGLPPSSAVATPEQPGGKMVVELVGAFNQPTERMDTNVLSTSSSRLLFKSLKVSIPILQTLALAPDGRSPLSKALSVAAILADLQMDAEVISASILREVLEAGAISIYDVRDRIGTGTAHLLHESFRVKNISSKVEILDDDSAAALRKFCLTYYDAGL
ncbi:hypothetical protein RJ639_012537 [Escallonia herrerae]|uniref:HD domain-containing protein n=1 Tax=Escallonia herrerae TaxID=1293975 RepID=A0AA89AR47_9ASTE|nr:hypothetical protein RJ639_012537 [Escallonia herrerae]